MGFRPMPPVRSGNVYIKFHLFNMLIRQAFTFWMELD